MTSEVQQNVPLFRSLVGKVASNEEDAYNLYNNYANFEVGFGIRVHKTRYNKKMEIRQKEYVCSCEGFKRDKESTEEVVISRLNVRSGCGAMVRFTVKENGDWVITHHVVEHNHYLAEPHERHLIRSARKVSQEKASIIQNLVNAGNRITNAYDFLAKDAQGEENLGFTKKDCYNYLHRVSLKVMEVGDAQSLIDYFRSKEEEDPLFYYSFQLDQEGRLTNIFWRDGKSMIDYEAFGDVVIFDTTYRTNKYDMICAPFVGVNHHGKNVMFGCAFLLDEKTESFTWLFRNFLHSMGGKAPKTIYTDQDQAMLNAIKEVFPESRHRLCQWHIWKKVGSYLGPLSKNYEFMSQFYSCFDGVESSNEFEETWQKMIVDFQCETNSWLSNLYDLRDKWSSGLNNDVFSAGILSTQRSESTNHVLNDISTATTCLTTWVQRFENLVNGWRRKESDEDFRCKPGTPYCEISNGMIKHAAKVYTVSLFGRFKAQYLAMLNTTWKEVYTDTSTGTIFYEVRGEEIDQADQWGMKSRKRSKETKGDHTKARVVTFDKAKATIYCSCKMFESAGILCRHALKILSVQNFTKVPERYILKRWTKKAKSVEFFPVSKEIPSQTKQPLGKEKQLFSSSRFRIAYNIILKAAENEATKAIWDDGFKKIMKDVDEELGKMKLTEDDSNEATIGDKDNNDGSEEIMPIKNPNKARTKGASRSRIKSSQEKRKVPAKKLKNARAIVTRAEETNISSAQQPFVMSNPSFHMLPTVNYDTLYDNQTTMMYHDNGMSYTSMLQSSQPYNALIYPQNGMSYTSMLQGDQRSQQYHAFEMTQGASYHGLSNNNNIN